MNAIASIRSRPTTYVAGFLSMFLGAVVVGSFATLLATAFSDGVSSADQETLVTMASVVGGWGLMIVLFSVASTMSVQVRQRAGELARYRMVGALPRQVRRMVLGEALVLGTVAVVLAVLPAVLVGRWVFGMLRDAGIVDPAVEHSAGVPFVAATSLLVLLVSLAAVRLCAHRPSRVPAVQALREGDQGERRSTLPWWRRIAVTVCLVSGAGLSVVTVAVMGDESDPYAAMQTAGPACIWWSLGLALLAPSVLRVAARLAGRTLERFGAPGYLAACDAGRRSQLLAGILAPVIVLVGMGLGTLYLMAIENHAAPVVGGDVTQVDADTLALLNYVVVGMVATFAAIMVVNTVASVVVDRRRELGQQRLVGATRGQVVATSTLEAVLVAVTGLVVGGLASLGTVVPYSLVKLDRPIPDVTVLWWVVVWVAAAVLTVGSTLVAVRRAVRTPALEAVGPVT